MNFLNRLIHSLESRVRTSFIYAIAELEDDFGELWGYDKEIEEMSETELKFLNKFEDWRKKILDNGNNQLRQIKFDLKRNGVICKPNYYEVRKESDLNG